MKVAPVFRWLCFSVIPALTPLVWLGSKLHAHLLQVNPAVLFGKGELLLACSAFAAAGIGELIGSGKRLLIGKFIAGGMCAVVWAAALDDYSDIGLSLRQGICYDVGYIALKGMAMCLCSVVSGAFCFLLGGFK